MEILFPKISGHSFRSTSAEILVNEGATGQQLQQKCNWKDPKMAMQYTRNSKPFQRQMASMLAGYEVENPPAKKRRISNSSGSNISNRTMNDPVIEDDGMDEILSQIEMNNSNEADQIDENDGIDAILSQVETDVSKKVDQIDENDGMDAIISQIDESRTEKKQSMVNVMAKCAHGNKIS